MRLADFSIRRPVAMSCVVIALTLFGAISYPRLGLDAFPQVEVPYVTVTTVYPGAGPAELEVEVARKIEDAVGTVDGLKIMKTSCQENVCTILLEFGLGISVDTAAADVREKLDTIRNDLPPGAETPEILKFDPNAAAVITLMLTGDLPLDRIYDYADDELSRRLATIPGVAEVKISGGEPLELRISLDSAKLGACGLTAADVLKKLADTNLKLPVGRFRQGIQEVNVVYDSEFKSLAGVGALEIGTYRDRQIYLRDVADISMESEEKRSLAFFNGEPGVMLRIVKKGDANAVRVISAVEKEIARLEQERRLPGGLRIVRVRDSGAFIRASVTDAWSSIAAGIGLTALIILIFLRNRRSVLIVGIGMPVTIIIAFGAMRIAGFTLNAFTLLALGTSVGVLVTNSIVVLESTVRRLTGGAAPAQAAAAGAQEAAAPVGASALTNVAVFVPVALMTSLTGRFLIPFAITMTIVTLVSLFISFTLTPLLCARWLGGGRGNAPAARSGRLEAWGRFLQNAFDRSLTAALRHPAAVSIAIFSGLILIAALLIPRVGVTFAPEDDQGELSVKLEFPTDCNLAAATDRALDVARRLRRLPEVLHTATAVGEIQGTVGQVSKGVYLAEITVVVRPKSERTASLAQLRERLRGEFTQFSGGIITVNVPSPVGGSGQLLELEISGKDLATLEAIAGRTAAILKTRPEARDVDTAVRSDKPEISIQPRRPELQNLGISSRALGNMLRTSVDGLQAGTYKIGDRSFDVRVKIHDPSGYEALPALPFATADNKPLSIDTIARLRPSTVPVQISRTDRVRVARVFANPAPGVGLRDLAVLAADIARPQLPPGYHLRFGGQVTNMQEAYDDFLPTAVLAVVLTYLLIAAIMESCLKPLLILFTVPPAAAGVLIALRLAGLPLSIFGMLGFIMLIGIVVNNAILIMDRLPATGAGLTPARAMRSAVLDRLRPIAMTSLAAVFGIVPLAFGSGIGSESRASCGMAVFGGLIASTLLTLYLVPALYVWFAGLGKPEKSTALKKDSSL